MSQALLASQTQIKELGRLINEAKTILVLQPEKPDTDSLTSSLALEQILGDLGKEVILYCQDKVPSYLQNFEGADRVQEDFPDKFDLTILVDTGSPAQLGRTLEKYQGRLTKKPFAVLDHHLSRESLPFDALEIVDSAFTSTCEMVLRLSQQFGYQINPEAANLLVPGMLADTRNLSIATVSSQTFRAVADLIDLGVNISQIHENYRSLSALTTELLELKGQLLSRLELYDEGRIGLIVVTPEELKKYAEIHDPADLILYEILNAKDVEIVVVIKNYGGQSGKIKISTRAKVPVAAKACAEFGGGGHDRAAGCQVNETPVAEVKAEFVKVLTKHIHDYHKTDQHPDPSKRAA